MNRFVLWLAQSVWFSGVYSAVLWASFPAETVANEVEARLSERFPQYRVDLGGVRPWWTGIAATDVTLSEIEGGVETPRFYADAIGVSVSLAHFLRSLGSTVLFDGFARVDGASIDGGVMAAIGDGQFRVRRTEGAIRDLPIETAVAWMPTATTPLEGEGALDMDWAFKIHDGWDKVSGSFSLVGHGVRLTKLSAPSIGFPDKEVDLPLDELVLSLDGEEGKLEVQRGVLRSTLASVDVEGEVAVESKVERSRLKWDVSVELGDWTGTDLAAMRGMAELGLQSARCDDGRYHYKLNTPLNRMSGSDLKPDPCDKPGAKPSARPSAPDASAPVPLSDREPATGPAGRPERPVRPIEATEPAAEPEVDVEAEEPAAVEEVPAEEAPAEEPAGGGE
jgi:type II secretion system protein N